jgi:hypothetical protein
MTKSSRPTGSAKVAENLPGAIRSWRRFLPLGLACGLPQLLRAENHVDYRYEYYDEDDNRMKVETHSVFFEQKLIESVTVKGELIYDGISGATPIGTHNLRGQVITTKVEDIRRAGNIGFEWRFGNHLITPGGAYSKEHDYESFGISLNDAIEFNEKNTILQLGVSHNFDSVRDANRVNWYDKDTTEGIVGVSQLLSPKTIFTAAFTFGNDSGFLRDPYRLAEYHPNIFPANFNIGVNERRPSHRNKEIVYTSLTHYFESLDASLEGSYRFYNDSYGVMSHTLGLTWHQKLGKHFILEPMFRVSEQSAADFYSTTFTGPFTFNPSGFHSSDYRLSEFYSLDYGLQATAIINDHVRVVAGYHRYEMNGLDNTSAAMYPQANVFTVGLSILW